MANADSALLVISRALWNPQPTTDAKSERYLAQALGYPRSWHIVRKIEEEDNSCSSENNNNTVGDQGGGSATPTTATTAGVGSSRTTTTSSSTTQRLIIVDRIFAGDPSSGVDCYFNHIAAQAAAEEWVEGESTGYEGKGGQLLPRKPKFQKGDQVKVQQHEEGQWQPATIQKRTERKEGYRYTVHYPQDDTTQKQVPEEDIQLMDDPYKMAEDLGLTEGWQAKLTGKKWKFSSPDGKSFTSKTAALKHKKKIDKEKAGKANAKNKKKEEPTAKQRAAPELSEGDPPWRTTGHEYLGRKVKVTSQHQKSATRTVTVEQVGTVVGWIADTDVDTNGEPGFISERTNKPANLFCVNFEEEPSHPYFTLLLVSQDLEEYELENCLLPPEEEPPAKKKRKT